MSRYWQKTLQETVGKTVTGLSDSAARFKQGWGDKPQTSPGASSQSSSPRHHGQPSPAEQDKQQYLRLPLESARKLRWYDREDLSNLVEVNLKDKKLLQSTIAALRQIIQDSGVAETSLDLDLRERIEEVERQAYYDEGVASVLLTALQHEASALQKQAVSQAEEIALLRQRLAQSEATPSAAVVHEQPVVLRISVQSDAPGNETAWHPTDQPVFSQGLDQSGRNLLNETSENESRPFRPDGSATPAAPSRLSGIEMPQDRDLDKTQSSGGDATSALLGKLQRVEEERRDYFEELARLNDLLRAHEAATRDSKDAAGRLEGDLSAERKARLEAEELAESRLQELKARSAAAQSQHAEMLRRAQDICLEAEDHAASLQKRLDKAESRSSKAEAELKESAAEVRRLTSELKAREKEKDRLEARAATAEGLLADSRQKGEAEKGGALAAALQAAKKAADGREAELRKAMQEGEEKLQNRIGQLESGNADLRRSLAKANTELNSLETTLAEAAEAESALQRDLRSLEVAAAERDELEAKVAALQERLDETRALQGQLANYKQIAKELEADRARVEDEIVATVRIATSLESRLQVAVTARNSADHAAALAEKRANEAEQRVEKEVARRLAQIGADESKWPEAAKEALTRQAHKLEAVHSMLARLQGELDAEQHSLAAEQAARHAVQAKLSAADDRLAKLTRESREAAQKLEREVAAAKMEVSDWRQETAAAEAELARVSSASRKTLAHQRTSSTGSHSSDLRRGGGSLPGIGEGEMANGSSGQIDHLYLKNVMLKFIVAVTAGRIEQCNVLLPAVATLLHASPAEYRTLRSSIAGQSSWWPQASP